MAKTDSKRIWIREQGFTLVELLIVVIILAILAAVVVPQFATSTDDAKLAAVDSTLANMRGVLDLYYAQHGEYPSTNIDGLGGGANSPLAFQNQLALYTDADGDAAIAKDLTHIYGPYLKKNEVPLEPMTDTNVLAIVFAGNLGITADGGDPGGWKFDNQTGQFIANHSSWDDR